MSQVNWESISLFIGIIILTLAITYWAAKKTKTTEEFYAAGRSITAFQNGLALTGDFVSASSFLGFTGLIALNGFDGIIYTTTGLMGWPLLLFLIAEGIRNLGKFTLADSLGERFSLRPIRLSSSISSLSIIIFYMIAQMVGAGYLIKLIFNIDYLAAELIVGAAMISYVMFGGMIATTWVQIIKAVLLLVGGFIMAILVLSKFNYNLLELFSKAIELRGEEILAPGKLYPNSFDIISLGLAFTFGTAGMPHLLMRFYTVPDSKAARLSAAYATMMIGFFYLLIFILGFGAMVLLDSKMILATDKGGNMSAILLANLLGGNMLMGFIAAVAFATILAVVAGLTLSGAATMAHDIWIGLIRKNAKPKEDMKVAKISALILGLLSIVLGIIFEGQNVSILVGLAFSIAASANFPTIFMSLFWKRFTTTGAISTMIFGTISSLVCICLSPTVMVDILGYGEAMFPLKNPGLFTIPASFIFGAIMTFITTDKKAYDGFSKIQEKMYKR